MDVIKWPREYNENKDDVIYRFGQNPILRAFTRYKAGFLEPLDSPRASDLTAALALAWIWLAVEVFIFVTVLLIATDPQAALGLSAVTRAI